MQMFESALKLNEVHTPSQTSDELIYIYIHTHTHIYIYIYIYIYMPLFVKRKLASSQSSFEIGYLIVVVLSKRIFIPAFQ